MKNLKSPDSQLTEVLFCLLDRKMITFMQMFLDSGIINLTARISDLRKLNLEIPCTLIKTTNKFGRNITYGSWKLTNKEKGIEIYNELLKH